MLLCSYTGRGASALLAAAASTITRRFGLDAPQPMAASTDLLGARSQRLVGYLRRAKGGTKECDSYKTVRLPWKDRLLATSHSQSHFTNAARDARHLDGTLVPRLDATLPFIG